MAVTGVMVAKRLASVVVVVTYTAGIMTGQFATSALIDGQKRERAYLPVGREQLLELEAAKGPNTDRHGDPLPPGALARVGTLRWGHGFDVFCVVFSRDGKTLASTDSHSIYLWEIATGKKLQNFREKQAGISSLAFSPDGKALAWGQLDGIHLGELTTGKEIHRFQGPGGATDQIITLALSRDGKLLAGGS